MNRNRISFGEFYLYKGIIPCIEIRYYSEDYEEYCKEKGKECKIDEQGHNRSGYLSAFRDYSFQVSSTKEGECDMGSSQVFGLDTFGSIVQSGRSNLSQNETVKYIMRCVIQDALLQFANSRYGRGIEFPSWREWDSEQFNIFMDACFMKYVYHEEFGEDWKDFYWDCEETRTA